MFLQTQAGSAAFGDRVALASIHRHLVPCQRPDCDRRRYRRRWRRGHLHALAAGLHLI